jgi:beta-N-acetylhexosaminidase
MNEMVAVAKEAPELSGGPARRADVALSARSAPEEFDTNAAREVFAKLVADEPQRKTLS